MSAPQLIVDTNVVSYWFNESPLGLAYQELVGDRPLGVTGLTLAEIHAGTVIDGWGRRRVERLTRFLKRFAHVPETEEMVELCGALVGQRLRAGRRMEWPDVWAAACALWLDVPLVTHDRDHERIPGLRVLTLHRDWQVREEGIAAFSTPGLWIGERSRASNPLVH